MLEVKNKKAYFDYFIESEMEAGIELIGTEIKSIRKGNVQLKDSYVHIKNNEAFDKLIKLLKYHDRIPVDVYERDGKMCTDLNSINLN